jgi:hypothetical protein
MHAVVDFSAFEPNDWLSPIHVEINRTSLTEVFFECFEFVFLEEIFFPEQQSLKL